MSQQTKCPNCGMYKIGYHQEPIKIQVPRRYKKGIGTIFFLIIAMFGAIIACPAFYSGAILESIFALSLTIGFMWISYMILYTGNDSKTVGYINHNTCSICGYKWDVRT